MSALPRAAPGRHAPPPPLTAPRRRNVIEYLPPAWISRLPARLPSFLFGRANPPSKSGSRVLQKVVTTGSSVQGSARVNLKISGAEFLGEGEDEALPALLRQLRDSPLLLSGPAKDLISFGSFEILYADETMRVTRTSNDHLAVNVRDDAGSAWF